MSASDPKRTFANWPVDRLGRLLAVRVCMKGIATGGRMKQRIARPCPQAHRGSGSMLLAIVLTGCAHTSEVYQWEPRSVAKQLGMPSCRVTVPLSESEVVETLGRYHGIEPEENPEWVAITSNHQPGDQIRVFDCKKISSFYALVRGDKVLFRYFPTIDD
jgi:hypothetical protein